VVASLLKVSLARQSVGELAVPPGLFLGDYMGIDAAANRFHLAFVTTNASRTNATDVRYAVVDR
jgi:hypothetical protein